MDINHATQLLAWLDKEHRQDKAQLLELQNLVQAQKALLNEQTQRLQELQAAIARLDSQPGRISELEQTIQEVRSEFRDLLEKHASQHTVLEEQRTRSEKMATKEYARSIHQLQEQVENLGSFAASLNELRAQDGKLQARVTALDTQLTELAKRILPQDERVEVIARQLQATRDELLNLRLALEKQNTQTMTLKAAADSIEPRIMPKIEQLQAMLQDLDKKRQADLVPFQVRQQEQIRLMEEMEKRLQEARPPVQRWVQQLEEFAKEFDQNKQVLYSLQEVDTQMRQRANELIELQRLATERQQIELREWQDAQVKVDENHVARINQLETRIQKTNELLARIQEQIDQMSREWQADLDEIWQCWDRSMQQQVDTLQNVIRQRRMS